MLGWLGCSLGDPSVEPALVAPGTAEVRERTMKNHQVAVHRARDAVIAQDLVGVRAAGERLAAERDVPLLPPPAQEALDEVREAGVELSQAADLDVAAERLVALTETCARCHVMLEVPPAVPLQATQRDLLWTALAFGSDEHWLEGARRDPALRSLQYWDDRRLAVLVRLQGGQF